MLVNAFTAYTKDGQAETLFSFVIILSTIISNVKEMFTLNKNCDIINV